MFLLPFIQDIEVCPEEKHTNKNTKDYVYLERNGEILKFNIELNHMDVVNALEHYLENISIFEFYLVNKKEVKVRNIPKKFLPHMGNFRLKNNLLSTENYLVPSSSYMLQLLTNKYYDNKFSSSDLFKLYMAESFDTNLNKNDRKEIVEILLQNIDIKLIEKYDINKIRLCIDNINELIKHNDSSDVLTELRQILSLSERSKEYINKLNLQDMFDDSLILDNQKQKVK